MTIQISEAAASEIKRLQSSGNKPDSYLRLGIKPGGCSGLLYTLQLETKQEEGDNLLDHNHIKIIIDSQSYSKLQNLQLDYSEDLMGGGFRFRNPNATSTCSCGQSFNHEQ